MWHWIYGSNFSGNVMNALGVRQTLVGESPFIRYRWADTHQRRGEDMRVPRTGHGSLCWFRYNQLWNKLWSCLITKLMVVNEDRYKIRPVIVYWNLSTAAVNPSSPGWGTVGNHASLTKLFKQRSEMLYYSSQFKFDFFFLNFIHLVVFSRIFL